MADEHRAFDLMFFGVYYTVSGYHLKWNWYALTKQYPLHSSSNCYLHFTHPPFKIFNWYETFGLWFVNRKGNMSIHRWHIIIYNMLEKCSTSSNIIWPTVLIISNWLLKHNYYYCPLFYEFWAIHLNTVAYWTKPNGPNSMDCRWFSLFTRNQLAFIIIFNFKCKCIDCCESSIYQELNCYWLNQIGQRPKMCALCICNITITIILILVYSDSIVQETNKESNKC